MAGIIPIADLTIFPEIVYIILSFGAKSTSACKLVELFPDAGFISVNTGLDTVLTTVGDDITIFSRAFPVISPVKDVTIVSVLSLIVKLLEKEFPVFKIDISYSTLSPGLYVSPALNAAPFNLVSFLVTLKVVGTPEIVFVFVSFAYFEVFVKFPINVFFNTPVITNST